MFAAFAKASNGTQTTHMAVRRTAIDWAKNNTQFIEPFLPTDEDTVGNPVKLYLAKMSMAGEWGDNLMLEALCRAHGVSVAVLKKLDEHRFTWMNAGEGGEEIRRIPLFLENHHYENLVTLGEVYNS